MVYKKEFISVFVSGGCWVIRVESYWSSSDRVFWGNLYWVNSCANLWNIILSLELAFLLLASTTKTNKSFCIYAVEMLLKHQNFCCFSSNLILNFQESTSLRVRKIIDVFQTTAVHEGNCLISVEPQINLRSGKLRNTVDYFWGHWMRPVVCVCVRLKYGS